MSKQYIPTSNNEFEENPTPTYDWDAAQRGIESVYKVTPIDKFLCKKIPPRELLLSPWLPKQGLAMVYAPRGVGKTHFSLEVAVAVATGGEFLEWKAPKPQKVLYIDGEMPSADLQGRLKLIEKRVGTIPSDNLLIMTPDEQSGAMPDISDPRSQALLQCYTSVDLVIVDNISTLCRTGNENEAESWLNTQNWALRLRAEGKSVLFVHHAGKGGNQRGTSKREDTLDTVIALRHPKDYNPKEGAKFEVHFEKARGFSGEQAEPLTVQLNINGLAGYQWEFSSLESEIDKKIIELYPSEKNQTVIAEELGVNKSTISRKIRNLKAAGKIY